MSARACVVGVWYKSLDAADKKAFKYTVNTMAARPLSRADLYGFICSAAGAPPFGLTALKQHLNLRCICE